MNNGMVIMMNNSS